MSPMSSAGQTRQGLHPSTTVSYGAIAGQFPAVGGTACRALPSGGTVSAMYRLGDELVVRLPLIEGGAGDVLAEREWLPPPVAPAAHRRPRGARGRRALPKGIRGRGRCTGGCPESFPRPER